MSLSISEIFTSWQGEGSLTGTPSIFVRVAGCHLRCAFCDTPYAQKISDGIPMTVEKILSEVRKRAENPTFPELSSVWKTEYRKTAFTLGIPEPTPTDRVRHIVLTGGEPMLFSETVELVQNLRASEFHVTIETAGTHVLPLECDLISISPKMENSSNALPLRDVSVTLATLTQNAHDYQIKFVTDTEKDGAEIADFLKNHPYLLPEKIFLMPQGQTASEILTRLPWVQDFARSSTFSFTPRAHLFWFQAKRGV